MYKLNLSINGYINTINKLIINTELKYKNVSKKLLVWLK